MTMSHTDPVPGEVDILNLNNGGLIRDIEIHVNSMSNSLNNAYRNERSRDSVRRAQTRILRAVGILFTRYIGDMAEKRTELNDKQDELDILTDEHNDQIRRYNNLRQTSRNMIARLDQEGGRLRRQIAVLRIQNQWRQFRLLNLQLNPPQPQPENNQVWLLFQ